MRKKHKSGRQHVSVLPLLKAGGITILVLVLFVTLVGIAAGLYQTHKMERSGEQAAFRSGEVPTGYTPDGFFQGNEFTGIGKKWQGKLFDSSTQSGVNVFDDGERYTFKIYPAQGLRDKDMQVLRIDYNQPGNPWWLKYVTDEIVADPGSSGSHYIGKIHVKVLGFTFTIGYFQLQAGSFR